jgi:hypothetical protein
MNWPLAFLSPRIMRSLGFRNSKQAAHPQRQPTANSTAPNTKTATGISVLEGGIYFSNSWSRAARSRSHASCWAK